VVNDPKPGPILPSAWAICPESWAVQPLAMDQAAPQVDVFVPFLYIQEHEQEIAEK
jgi:hypothetical protein